MKNSAEASSRRVYSLDALKFLAIIVILFHHFQQETHATFAFGVNWCYGSFYWGYLVELFFVISGFVTFRYVDRIQCSTAFAPFFLKKYIRFLPMLLVAGVAYLATNLLYRTVFELGGFPFSVWTVASSLLGIARWLNTSLMVNNPTWYISVLLLCYVYFFFAVRICRRIKTNPAIGFFVVMQFGIVMSVLNESFGLSFPFFNGYIARGLISFFVGVLLYKPAAYLSKECGGRLTLVSGGVVLVYVLLYVLKPSWANGGSGSLAYTLYFIVFPCVVLFFYSEPVQKLFSSKAFSGSGAIAYSMYMWHIPILFVFLCVAHWLGVPADSRFAMYAFLACCIVWSFFSRRFLEESIQSAFMRIETAVLKMI